MPHRGPLCLGRGWILARRAEVSVGQIAHNRTVVGSAKKTRKALLHFDEDSANLQVEALLSRRAVWEPTRTPPRLPLPRNATRVFGRVVARHRG